MTKKLTLVVVLLVAFGLRVHGLTAAPPGLTHDEANHGWEALQVLSGNWLYYFPIGYGREPLYGYTLAGVILLFGRSIFALRYVSAVAGVAGIAATAAWAKRWLGDHIALAGAAFMAVSFWSVAIGRQMLRSSLMPLLMATAVLLWWHMATPRAKRGGLAVGFAAVLALMLHTYIATRAVWILFPLFGLYAMLWHRPQWWPTRWAAGGSLALGWLMAAPLFIHLARNPQLETRLEMLSGTLTAVQAGNWEPLFRHVREGVLALFWPGAGDAFWAYNIPGRPTLLPLTAVCLVVGVMICLWRWRNSAPHAFLGLWLLIGLAPSLVTGATANTTRNIAALPALYLVAAVGLVGIQEKVRPLGRWAPHAVGGLVVGVAAVLSTHDYFTVWANLPQVRAAYQTTIMAAVEAVNQTVPVGETAVLSSVYPGPAHDPSIAQLVVDDGARPLRWVDARRALIFPTAHPFQLVTPASTPLHPFLAAEWATAGAMIPLRPTDLDPTYQLHTITPPVWPTAVRANFGGGLALLDAYWLAENSPPGGVAELLTVWRVLDPAHVGPVVPPTFTVETNLFTHVLWPDGSIFVQADYVDAPAWDWQAGDVVVQIHQFYVPPETAVGDYAAVVGVYAPSSGVRLVVQETGGDTAAVPPLRVR